MHGQHVLITGAAGCIDFVISRLFVKQCADVALPYYREFGEANHIDYATSKGALHSGFIKSLKNEIVNIIPHARCNIVAPGWTRTPMAESSIEQGRHLKALRTMPLRKVATTEDVAQACLFFASNKTAGHLTGNVLMVHGGMEGRVLWPENSE
ncbi:unnamed protein product [Rotaria sp. Silwood1]|nr:unnamed protein product [Rotaria sp. Silwood1]